MEELITITKQDGKQIVSARELHSFLNVKDNVNTWFKAQSEKAMLDEEEDYTTLVLPKVDRQGGMNKLDYALTLNSAKEIAMLNGGEKGKQARQYFIACEKRLLTPKIRTHLEVLDSERAILIANEKTNALLLEANVKIEADKPKVVFCRRCYRTAVRLI